MTLKSELLKNSRFLDFSPLKRYNLPTRTRSSMEVLRCAQDKLLTSNCALEVSILSLGEIYVHPLYRVDSRLSITSIISILSTLVATRLHQKTRCARDRGPRTGDGRSMIYWPDFCNPVFHHRSSVSRAAITHPVFRLRSSVGREATNQSTGMGLILIKRGGFPYPSIKDAGCYCF
jgi:hypothetical protein